MTKQAIVTSIVNALGENHNHELYERVKDRVVALRAKFLRQSFAKYGIDSLLEQTYTVEMVQKTDEFGCIYLESKCKVYMPIRTSDTSYPFSFVGTSRNAPFTFLRGYETETIPRIPINQLNRYYTVDNMKIRTYNSTAKVLTVKDVLEDFGSLDVNCEGTCGDDDTLLPMPADFAGDIITVLTAEFSQTLQIEKQDGDEVED